MKTIVLFLIYSGLIISCPLSFCQIPILDLVAIDTVNFEIETIRSVELIDYNNDASKEFYIKTDSASYLFDGENHDLIWQSPPIINLNNQCLHFIESLNVWRNHVLEKISNTELRITWYDLPEIESSDSIIWTDSVSFGPFYDFVHIDYCNLDDNEYLLAQINTWGDHGGDWYYDIGRAFIFDIYDNSFIRTIECYRPFSSYIIQNNDQSLLCLSGNEYFWADGPEGQDIYDYNSYISIIDEDFNNILNYHLFDAFLRKAVIRYNTDSQLFSFLSSSVSFIKQFDDILDESSFDIYQSAFGTCFANYINYNNQVLVIICNPTGYFELVNSNLSFNSYIQNDLPEGIFDIQTEDINTDGSDEVFCNYEDKIIICELQDNVGIGDPSGSLPVFHIGNYPNPFNSSTNIQYSLSQDADVTIDIFDILGRRVETLVQAEQQAGYHQVIWDAKEETSGVYFYKLQAGDFVNTKKMVLLK